ncbi:MAG: metallophosphoesterase [Kiritimatiellales bacterium]
MDKISRNCETPDMITRRHCLGRLGTAAACAAMAPAAFSQAVTIAGIKKLLFSFGLLTDVHVADKDTNGKRNFRAASESLKRCVDDLNRQNLAFTIELGDFIDGGNSRASADLEHALSIYGGLTMPAYHALGNHGVILLRKYMDKDPRLNGVYYYDFTSPAAAGWRFIVLDGNDAGYGIVSNSQLEWLDEKLTQAKAANEKVIMFCHYALLKEAAPRYLMAEPEPVLNLINNAGCVAAYFAGHHHGGGYTCQDGIYHVTVKGMVEHPEENAYAVVEVYSDRIKEIGHGQEPSREMRFT